MKSYLRKYREWARQDDITPAVAIHYALDWVSPENCRNLIAHCQIYNKEIAMIDMLQ